MNTSTAPATIVLVHGGFVDGSGWRPVYDAHDGPVVLVGHSYGGAVISEAGTHPNVAALVYISAFAPDKDESVNTLINGFPAGGPQPPILPPRDGFLFLDRDKFPAAFAAGLPAGLAAFMADSQVPWAPTPSPGRSPTPPGEPGRAGTWSPPRTR